MSRRAEENAVIEALAALAQPTRLAVFRRLLAAHPDAVPAGELARLCEVPHNTMSTHLGILARARLISCERQGRVMNYRTELNGLRGLLHFLTDDCCNGRPDLCGERAPGFADDPGRGMGGGVAPAFNVLFLCTHNSARSIIAEPLLQRIGNGRFNAYSAGAEPAAEPAADVVERLLALGHDVSNLRCKSWHEFARPTAPRMDFIITLCAPAPGLAGPDFGDRPVTAVWPLPDPAMFTGSALERATFLNELYGMTRRRIEAFVGLPFASLDRRTIQSRLDEIGDARRILR